MRGILVEGPEQAPALQCPLQKRKLGPREGGSPVTVTPVSVRAGFEAERQISVLNLSIRIPSGQSHWLWVLTLSFPDPVTWTSVHSFHQ